MSYVNERVRAKYAAHSLLAEQLANRLATLFTRCEVYSLLVGHVLDLYSLVYLGEHVRALAEPI